MIREIEADQANEIDPMIALFRERFGRNEIGMIDLVVCPHSPRR
jgi:hypothetical protein